MSVLFGGGSQPQAPPVPPPPPNPPQLAQPSIMEQGASERASLAAGVGGEGTLGTDVTGGQGSKAPSTTKSLLGG